MVRVWIRVRLPQAAKVGMKSDKTILGKKILLPFGSPPGKININRNQAMGQNQYWKSSPWFFTFRDIHGSAYLQAVRTVSKENFGVKFVFGKFAFDTKVAAVKGFLAQGLDKIFQSR